MNVPGWWETVLLALAAYRVWRLVALDDITEPLRAFLVGSDDDDPEDPIGTEVEGGYWEALDDFIACPFCLGFWTAVAWWGAWEAWPHWTLVAASPWALSAAVAIIATRVEAD